MDTFEENAIRIANYLEDKMSSSEEEIFMQELGTNESLRRQYEEEILVSALLPNEKEESEVGKALLLQSADEHVNMIEAALEKKVHKKNKAPVIKMLSDYRTIAAAAVFIILISLIFIFTKKDSRQQVVATGNKSKTKDSGSRQSQVDNPVLSADSSRSHLNTSPGNTMAKNIFEKYYTPYSGGGNDPVEISEYYSFYKNGEYSKVLSAKDADFQLMGVDARNKLLEQYMQLYKGLACLAENKPVDAARNFNLVMQSSPKTDSQFYDAQWYYMLTLLKQKDLAKANNIARLIASSSSPYRLKAVQILDDIK